MIATPDQRRAAMEFLAPLECWHAKLYELPPLDQGYAQAMQAWADFCKPRG